MNVLPGTFNKKHILPNQKDLNCYGLVMGKFILGLEKNCLTKQP